MKILNDKQLQTRQNLVLKKTTWQLYCERQRRPTNRFSEIRAGHSTVVCCPYSRATPGPVSVCSRETKSAISTFRDGNTTKMNKFLLVAALVVVMVCLIADTQGKPAPGGGAKTFLCEYYCLFSNNPQRSFFIGSKL